MDYAMKSLSLLTPSTLSKCVSSGVCASASLTQQLLSGPAPRQRPFRVTNAERTHRKGIMAATLQDLIDKASESLDVPCVQALVLDEDGTDVDTEDFFSSLPDNTAFMLLDKGQTWSQPPNLPPREQPSERGPASRTDVAKVTFDLYKNNPKDFIGCLNVRATLYGAYSVSYDLRCYAAKNMLKEALRWTIFSMQFTGHVLLGSSCYMEQLMEDEEQAENRLTEGRGKPTESALVLPKESRLGPSQEGRVRQLQSLLLGRMSY